jgi:hypothetical protein
MLRQGGPGLAATHGGLHGKVGRGTREALAGDPQRAWQDRDEGAAERHRPPGGFARHQRGLHRKPRFGSAGGGFHRAVGGSWSFIIAFLAFLALWAITNAWLLSRDPFDPYPFVFLNLILSMLAALQAPVIMMSQNRQSERDRLAAAHDYAVNLKAEIEIMALHEKLDEMRHSEIVTILSRIETLAEQLERIERAAAGNRGAQG